MLASKIVLSALMAMAQQAGEKWEVVTSEEGGYKVEMPAAQEQTGSVPMLGPDGSATQHETFRQPGGVQYWIIRMENRGPIPKASEARWLAYAQEKAPGRFGSGARVVSEKKVKLGSIEGREFEIKVEPKGGPSTHMKGRAFVKGRTAYTLLAVSSFPGEDVSAEKAARFLNSLALTDQPEPVAGGPGGPPGFGLNIQTKSSVRRSGGPMAGGPATVQRSGGFTFGGPPAVDGPGGPRWIHVSSRPDGYAVEMPGQPNGEENESSDGFEVQTRSFQTRTVEFLITVVRGPTEVPQAEEAKALGRIRDQVIGKYGKDLKVVGERATKAGTFEGREYAMTLDRHSVGDVKARARAYARGKKVYLVGAISMVKGQDLPADVVRFLDSFSLAGEPGGSGPKAGVADRSPRRVAIAPLKAWGKEVDPAGDVQIKAAGDVLAMTIPASPHVLAPERDLMNAPRVVAPTRGDFTATVRVEGPFDPSEKSTVKGLSSRQAGGLVLWKDAQNYIVLQRRAASGEEGKETHQVVLEEVVAGRKGVTHRQPARPGPITVKLEHKGGRVLASFSVDGDDWKEFKPVDAAWSGGEVQVGVVAVNTSTTPHSIHFRDYSLQAK